MAAEHRIPISKWPRLPMVMLLMLAPAVALPADPDDPKLGAIPIEAYGALPFYSEDKFYGTLTITPLPAEGRSLLTYTGNDAPFDPSWVEKKVEFAGFRCHKNPIAYPPNGIPNGNYFPGLITCRYSHVVEVVDGRNLMVDFVYNGGNLETPRPTPQAYGYFFVDCRAAFARTFSAEEPATRFVLRDGQTYVCKGGWNAAVGKDIEARAPNKASIKFSMEDAFMLGEEVHKDPNFLEGEDRASYLTTFTSGRLFTFQDNTAFNVRIENIDLLPPHYRVPDMRLNRGGLSPLFLHRAGDDYETNLQGRWIHGKRELSNCDNQTEARRWAEIPFPSRPWFLGGSLCASNDGGKLSADSTDIEHYQEFNFHDVGWFSFEPMGLRSVNRAGNIFRLVNKTRKQLHAGNAMTNTEWFDTTLRFRKDTAGSRDLGLRAIELMDGATSIYQLANTVHWAQWGHLAYPDGEWRRSGRFVFRDEVNGCEWNLSFPTPGLFVRHYPAEETLDPRKLLDQCVPYVDAVTLRAFEMIPVSDSAQAKKWGLPQTVIQVGDRFSRKLSDTKFVFEEYALQALKSYPWLKGNGEGRGDVLNQNEEHLNNKFSQEIYPVCDELEYTDGAAVRTVRVISRTRRSYSPPNARFVAIPYWIYEFDQPVALDKPTFRVKKSSLEFALNPAGVRARIRLYPPATAPHDSTLGYLCYTSKSLNWEMQNVDIRGYIRASDHDQPKRTAADPLWRLSIIKSWKACRIDGDSNALWGQNTLKARREKTGDSRHRAIVDNTDIGAGVGNMKSPSGAAEIPED